MATRQIEVWFDATSGDDLYCVSLCSVVSDGQEIKCLSTHRSRRSAIAAGRKAAKTRGLDCAFREESGVAADL
jgi:hypothetical protein